MFACDVTELTATETLAAATEAHATRTHADLQLIELALRFADLYPDPATIPGHVRLPGGERGWFHGGPGCPGFAEFAAAEFGAAIGRSAVSAAIFIGQALALRHRHPLILAMVRSGHAEPWKARSVATACLPLSVEAAAIVDRRVARIINTVTPPQLEKIIKAAIHQADPEGARAAADQKARERGVYAGRTDEHGTTTLHIRASTGAVIRFKATLRQIADALADLGHTEPLQQRMAMAVEIISDPALAHELLGIAHHLGRSSHTSPSPEADEKADPTPTPTPDSGADLEPTRATAASADAKAEVDVDVDVEADVEAEADVSADAEAETDAAAAADVDVAAAADLAADVDVDVDVDGTPAGEPRRPSDWCLGDEPGMDDEADRDSPHPSGSLYDAPSTPSTPPSPADPSARGGRNTDEAAGPAMDPDLRREVAAKLNAIRQNAYTSGTGSTGRRPATTTVYLHITDWSLLGGENVVARVERFGPVFAARLEELLGHGQIIIKPVIDLNEKLSVNAYEIPDRIREHVKLTHPVEQFPYGTAETTNSTDLDHIKRYNFKDTGPPGQTRTTNLAPLRRFSHRVKTRGDWTVQRLNDGALEWITRHGLKFRVDHHGTHPITQEGDDSR